ncbi:MAG: hypothetical protein QNJ36_18535 [Calothrix sp. MO_167.B42]|nr:hypothetical protein [Calothrix sp. MO_167.B42]
MKSKSKANTKFKPKFNNLAKTVAQFGLILSLLVVAAACGGDGGYEQVDENVQENRQSVNVTNDEVDIECSGSAKSTTTVNGRTYKCENGRVRRVR